MPYHQFQTQWRDAQVRNDVDVIKNALLVAPFIDRRTFLDTVAPVFGWTADVFTARVSRMTAGTILKSLSPELKREGTS